MSGRLPDPIGSTAKDPFLLSREEFATLLILGNQGVEIHSEVAAEEVATLKRNYPPLVTISEPSKPELRAGVQLKAAATWKGRSLLHAYELGRASMLETVERKPLLPKTEQPKID